MKHTYSIEGMHCEGCTEKIKKALEQTPQVTEANVTLSPPKATVEMNTHISVDQLNSRLKEVGSYQLKEEESTQLETISSTSEKSWVQTYFPLILIAAYLVGGVLLRELSMGRFSLHTMMTNFMGGFFVVFSFFKILDLKGFAEGYSTYDIVAQKYPIYGKIYPFVELLLGLLYLLGANLVVTAVLTVVVMGVSSVGVIKSILAGRQIQCACLGTIFKLPLTNITVFEDLLMVGMALMILFTGSRS